MATPTLYRITVTDRYGRQLICRLTTTEGQSHAETLALKLLAWGEVPGPLVAHATPSSSADWPEPFHRRVPPLSR